MRNYIFNQNRSHGSLHMHVKKLSNKKYKKLREKGTEYQHCSFCSSRLASPPKLVTANMPIHRNYAGRDIQFKWLMCPTCCQNKSQLLKNALWSV